MVLPMWMDDTYDATVWGGMTRVFIGGVVADAPWGYVFQNCLTR
jgi:hypothetical protein